MATGARSPAKQAAPLERVLVAGGSGFIGTNLVNHFRRRGSEVLNLDPKPPRNPDERGSWARWDPLDSSALGAALHEFQPSSVLHMGARTDLDGTTDADYASNIDGVRVVSEALCTAPNVCRTIFASSRMVCRAGYQPVRDDDYCPPNAYGRSKMLGENIVRQASLPMPWTIVRPTSIWGPWFDVPYREFFISIARGRYVHIKGHAVRKSFGFVGNSVHQIERLLAAPAPAIRGRTLYLGDYPAIDVREMAERIRTAVGSRPIHALPLGIVRPAARVGDAAKRLGWPNPPLTSFRLTNLITEMLLDLSPLEDIVGPLPFSMDQGIEITVVWLRKNGHVR